jgi:hypothetical protein
MSQKTNSSRMRDVVGALSTAERVTGVGCVLAFIGVFFKWKANGGSSGTTPGGYSYSYAGTSLSGLHSWGSLTLLIALASVAYFVIRSPLFRSTVAVRKLPVGDAAFFMIAGIAEIVTVLMYSHHFAGGTLKLGFYLTLLGAALTAFGGPLAQRVFGGGAAPGPERPPASNQQFGSGPPVAPGGGPPNAEGS